LSPSALVEGGIVIPEQRILVSPNPIYNDSMQRKMFWTIFGVLGLVADMALPFWWAIGATIPLGWLSWWIAYRSDWF
jgi:hypothetical protein